MLDNFLFSVNAVLPIFLIIFLGYVLRRKAVLSEKTIEEMNSVVFTLALPLLLFKDVYQADFAGFFDVKLVVWAVAASVISFALIWVFAEIYLIKKPRLTGAFVQGAFRGNFAILGLPLIANILGGAGTGKAALVVTAIVPTYNILAVVVLSAKNIKNSGNYIRKTLLSICRNPLIIAVCVGVLFSAFNIRLPSALNAGINYMGSLCTPLALIAVGGAIEIAESIKNIRYALAASLYKTVVSPLIFIAIFILALGFRGEALIVLYVLFSAPTAVSSYIMATKMEADANLASSILILTTVFSVIGFTVGIYLLKMWAVI